MILLITLTLIGNWGGFTLPETSGEFAHFSLPMLTTESIFETAKIPIDYLWPNMHPAKRYMAAFFIVNVSDLIIFNTTLIRRHYSTPRENDLARNGWAIYSLLKLAEFGIRVPLWNRRQQRKLQATMENNTLRMKYLDLRDRVYLDSLRNAEEENL